MEYGGVHMISAATSDEDLAYTLEAAEESLDEVLQTARPELGRLGQASITDEHVFAFGERAFGATRNTLQKWWTGLPHARTTPEGVGDSPR